MPVAGCTEDSSDMWTGRMRWRKIIIFWDRGGCKDKGSETRGEELTCCPAKATTRLAAKGFAGNFGADFLGLVSTKLELGSLGPRLGSHSRY